MASHEELIALRERINERKAAVSRAKNIEEKSALLIQQCIKTQATMEKEIEYMEAEYRMLATKTEPKGFFGWIVLSMLLVLQPAMAAVVYYEDTKPTANPGGHLYGDIIADSRAKDIAEPLPQKDYNIYLHPEPRREHTYDFIYEDHATEDKPFNEKSFTVIEGE